MSRCLEYTQGAGVRQAGGAGLAVDPTGDSAVDPPAVARPLAGDNPGGFRRDWYICTSARADVPVASHLSVYPGHSSAGRDPIRPDKPGSTPGSGTPWPHRAPERAGRAAGVTPPNPAQVRSEARDAAIAFHPPASGDGARHGSRCRRPRDRGRQPFVSLLSFARAPTRPGLLHPRSSHRARGCPDPASKAPPPAPRTPAGGRLGLPLAPSSTRNASRTGRPRRLTARG